MESFLEISHCSFPENLLYDLENLVWVRVEGDTATIGATSLLSALSGRLTAVRFREIDGRFESGHSLGVIESLRYVGAVRTPLSGRLIEHNNQLLANPRLLNDFPYDKGWFARLTTDRSDEIGQLKRVDSIRDGLELKIAQLRVRCFKAYPDHEMYEVGVECAAVLARLNEIIPRIGSGEIVHVVSDDPTAYVELVRWADQTGNRIIDWREEGTISHFLVQKMA